LKKELQDVKIVILTFIANFKSYNYELYIMIELINKNVEKFGHHITVVGSGAEPRYAYTVGVTQKLGFELLFAGGYTSCTTKC